MSRPRPLAALLLVCLLAACGGAEPIPARDLALRVDVGLAGNEIELGRSFPLEVVRVWSRDLVPEAWDDRRLAPLRVQLVEHVRREDDARVEERRRYRAYAFAPGEVVVAAPELRARPRAGGEERVVRAQGIRLRVRASLDPDEAGSPEPPPGPLAEPASSWPWLGLALLLGALLTAGVTRRLRRVEVEEAEPPAAPAPPPEAGALARLEALRAGARSRRAPGEVEADVVAATEVVREYVGARYRVRAAVKTTEELLAACPANEVLRSSLAGLLAGPDRVKFAAFWPGAADRDGLLDGAVAFVRETSASGTGGVS